MLCFDRAGEGDGELVCCNLWFGFEGNIGGIIERIEVRGYEKLKFCLKC